MRLGFWNVGGACKCLTWIGCLLAACNCTAGPSGLAGDRLPRVVRVVGLLVLFFLIMADPRDQVVNPSITPREQARCALTAITYSFAIADRPRLLLFWQGCLAHRRQRPSRMNLLPFQRACGILFVAHMNLANRLQGSILAGCRRLTRSGRR